MSLQEPSLSFQSIFEEGVRVVEHQNHIFPESGIVTCSIIESSRGSLICVPVTDGLSSDCDSYLTVTEVDIPKETFIGSSTENVCLRSKSSPGVCIQEEETGSKLFVHTHHGQSIEGPEVLLLTSEHSPVLNVEPVVTQKEASQLKDTDSHSNQNEKKICKRGGWPKGKKRKKGLSETVVPKGPTTGYVLFLNKRRKQVQKSCPELPFTEVTKQLGHEWTNLPVDEKKDYLKRAEEEKIRYREELKQYQQSEVCQAYAAKKKKSQMESEGGTNEKKDSNEAVPVHDIEGEDFRQLYCVVCDQLFTSQHNKKEHLYGKLHLSNITSMIHEVASLRKRSKVCKNRVSEDVSSDPKTSDTESRLQDAIVSVSDAMDLVTSFSRDQLNEIHYLKQCCQNLHQHKKALERDLKLLEELFEKRKGESAIVKVEGKNLSSQLIELRMVPTLFGIINF